MSHLSPDTDSFQSSHCPPIRPVDSTSSTCRQLVHLSTEHLYQYFGYRNIDKLLKHLPTLTTDHTKLRRDKDDSLDSINNHATIHKARANKKPIPWGDHFAHTVHMDIGYGSDIAIDNVRYCLFLIDRATRQKYTYPLSDLAGTTITNQLEQFITDIGITPSRILTDCDPKLLNGAVMDFARQNKITLTGAPKGRQNQNGLAERNWYTCVRMARSWLSAAGLPPKFWYFAIKRAAEISNYFPVLHNDTVTTPFELAHRRKPDFRTLFPMFSLSYVRQTTNSDSSPRHNFIRQTTKCIAVGRDPTSDGLLFFNPKTNRTLSSADYRLDPSKPSGVAFRYPPSDTLHFHLHDSKSEDFRPPEFDMGDTVLVSTPDLNISNEKASVLSIPLSLDDYYTVQLLHDGTILQLNSTDMSPLPQSTSSESIADAPTWVAPNIKCTLFIPTKMPRPLQGFLLHNSTGEWSFSPGRKQPSRHPPIPLHNFANGYANYLTRTRCLVKGFQRKSTIIQQQQLHQSSDIVALHVSATNLHSPNAPPSLKYHNTLHPDDKATWDEAYAEEYNGLQSIQAFEYITEEQYNLLRNTLGQILPSMAISTIKSDEDGKPLRAKYRIVTLGNLDKH